MSCLNPQDPESKRVYTPDGSMCCLYLPGGGLALPRPRRAKVFALDGDKWKVRPDGNYARKGGNGLGVSEAEVMYTLTTADRHVVAVVNDKAAKTERDRQNG